MWEPQGLDRLALAQALVLG